jgi:hypothetical protein
MMAAAPGAMADQPGTVMSGYLSYHGDKGGFVMHYRTIVEPPRHAASFNKLGGGVTSDEGKVHRFMYDDTNQVYFGYDLSVEPVPGASRSRVTFEPLSLTADQLRVNFKPLGSGFRSVLIPRYPPPQVVDNGDTIALDLLVSPDGQQKVVDYLQISSTGPSATTNRHTVEVVGPVTWVRTTDDSEPRDFSVSDLELRIADPSVQVNGQAVPGVAMGEAAGSIIWLYIPGHGRFLLSIAPLPGFQKAGTVHHTILNFRDGGDEYEVRTSSPVMQSAKRWNVYVLRDSLYDPRQAKPSVTFGAANRLEELVGVR